MLLSVTVYAYHDQICAPTSNGIQNGNRGTLHDLVHLSAGGLNSIDLHIHTKYISSWLSISESVVLDELPMDAICSILCSICADELDWVNGSIYRERTPHVALVSRAIYTFA